MSKQSFDLAVIGGGPGGYAAAILAAQQQRKVVVFEAHKLGGTCLNVGCIPTKFLLHKAALIAEIRRQAQGGFLCKPGSFSWKKAVEEKNQVTRRLSEGVRQLLTSHRITVVPAQAEYVDAGTIHAANQDWLAAKIIVATGSQPIPLPLPGAEYALDSTALLNLERAPATLGIIGGGVIGLEFASLFAALGTRVTVVEMCDRLLVREDREMVTLLQKETQKSGIEFYLGERVQALEAQAIVLANGTCLEAEYILAAAGRKAVDFAVADAERQRDGSFAVDEFQRTSVEDVYAVGDAAGSWQLAHAAYLEAEIAVNHLCGIGKTLSREWMPRCIYSLPQLAAVGVTEEELRTRQIAYRRGVFPLAASGRALADGSDVGMVKVLTAESDGRLLGIHAVGVGASEWIAPGVVAVNSGSRAEDLAAMVFPHPSYSEAFKEAVAATQNRSLHLPGR